MGEACEESLGIHVEARALAQYYNRLTHVVFVQIPLTVLIGKYSIRTNFVLGFSLG